MPKTDTSFATYTSMMRVTTKGRPYTKDLYDIFAAVLLQVNLTDHRVMFRTYPYTFTTDEAAKVMESLVFIHVHRKPDPADPSRQIATRTTTTFSMDYNTAKSLMQHFLSARLIMNATDPSNWSVRDKGLWCPTLKGKYVMEEFTDSTQVEMTDTLIAALNAPYMSPGSGSTGSRIITLERLTENDDQITFNRSNMTAAFKAMMASLPRSALLIDEMSGLDKRNLQIYQHTFMSTHCVEWLSDRLTVISVEEAESVAAEFVLFGWIAQVLDKSDKAHSTRDNMSFKTSRNAIYHITERGCNVIGLKLQRSSDPMEDGQFQASSSGVSVDSDSSSSKKVPYISTRTVAKSARSRQVSSESTAPTLSRYNHVTEGDGLGAKTTTAMTRHDSATTLIEQALSHSSISPGSGSAESIVPEKSQVRFPLQRPPSMSLTDSQASTTDTDADTDAAVNRIKDTSQWTRLTHILEAPLMRMYFREFLRSNYCVENINFWVDHNKLLGNLKRSNKTVLEQIAQCYTIYETYLGPSATADLNIDHTLHRDIVKYFSTVFVIVHQTPPKTPYFISPSTLPVVTNQPVKSSQVASRLLLMPPQANSKHRIVTVRGISPERCLDRLLKMFGRVNDHVCSIMAEDSVPKFVKTQKYKELIAQQQNAMNVDESDDDDDDGFDFEDSSDDDGDEANKKAYTTALSAQRSSMDHQRHGTIVAN